MTSTTPAAQRKPGWHRILDAFMAERGRTLTNVQLGQIPGVQAFHQRISDLGRHGYIITPAVKVADGRYAYKLVGLDVAAAQGLPHDGALDRLGPSVGVQIEDAVTKLKADKDRLAKLGSPAAPAARASVEEHRTRERINELKALVESAEDERHAIEDKLREALGERAPLDSDLEALVSLVAEIVAKTTTTTRGRTSATGTDTGPMVMRKILEAAGRPMHSREMERRLVAISDVYSGSSDVHHTMFGSLARSNRTGGVFELVGVSAFALREWPAEKKKLAPIPRATEED